MLHFSKNKKIKTVMSGIDSDEQIFSIYFDLHLLDFSDIIHPRGSRPYECGLLIFIQAIDKFVNLFWYYFRITCLQATNLLFLRTPSITRHSRIYNCNLSRPLTSLSPTAGLLLVYKLLIFYSSGPLPATNSIHLQAVYSSLGFSITFSPYVIPVKSFLLMGR